MARLELTTEACSKPCARGAVAVAVALAVAVSLASCNGNSTSPGSSLSTYKDFASIASVAHCSNTTEDSTPDVAIGSISSSSGECDINGARVTIRVYADNAHVQQALRAAQTAWCPFGKSAFGYSEINFSVGTNWLIQPRDNLDKVTTQATATALGGVTKTVTC